MASAEHNDGDDDGVDWTAVTCLVSSNHRKEVAEILQENGHLTPTAISDRGSLPPTHVSRALNGLRDEDLVELLVPESTRKGRIYALTDAGERALDAAQEVDA